MKFDIKKFLQKRPLSWSALNTFSYGEDGPAKWYSSYILGKRQSSKEMTFGNLIDKRFQDDPAFLPHLTRYPILQHKMEAMFAGIPLIGIADQYHPDIPAIRDLKTGKKAWDKKRADETGQLSFYALLLYATKKIKPEDVEFYIDWLPTQETGSFEIEFINENDVKTFKTKRTMLDVAKFGQRIKDTVSQMEQYVHNHLRQESGASILTTLVP